MMVAFAHPEEAVQCAMAVQRALDDDAKRMWDKKIRVRIGIQMGKSVRRGDDLFGRNVAMAPGWRLRPRAAKSWSPSRCATRSANDVAFETARNVELKGFRGTYRLYPVEPTPISCRQWRSPGSAP